MPAEGAVGRGARVLAGGDYGFNVQLLFGVRLSLARCRPDRWSGSLENARPPVGPTPDESLISIDNWFNVPYLHFAFKPQAFRADGGGSFLMLSLFLFLSSLRVAFVRGVYAAAGLCCCLHSAEGGDE